MDESSFYQGLFSFFDFTSFTYFDFQFFPEKTEEKLKLWTRVLLDNEVETVGDLAIETVENIRAYGIPGNIATKLFIQCQTAKAERNQKASSSSASAAAALQP
jgi:hypothetical protein